MGNYFNELRGKIIRANNLQFKHQVIISELRVRLVEAFQYMYFFSWQFQGCADFVDNFFKFTFHVFMLSSPGDIYVKNLTYTLYCGGVCGVGGAIKALLV